jgi:small-conductance mechanosensitive channel
VRYKQPAKVPKLPETLDFKTEVQDGVRDFINDMANFLPKLVGFIVILVIGYFVAKLISRGAKKVLKKINFDYYVDKSGIGAPLERAGFQDSGKFAGKVIYYLIMLFVLKLAFASLDIVALEEPFNQLIGWIPKALIALVLIVVGGIIANGVRDIIRGITAGQSYQNLVTNVAYSGIWIITTLLAMDQIGIGEDVVNALTNVLLYSIGAIIVIKFGVGGIWAARDRFWPGVYDKISAEASKPPRPQR